MRVVRIWFLLTKNKRIMKYKEIEEIKKEFFLLGLLQKEAEFECFADGMFSYYIYDDECMHEICIINDNASFMKKEKIIDLLELEGTFYLDHAIYSKNPEIEVSRKTFRIVDQDDYIEDNLN